MHLSKVPLQAKPLPQDLPPSSRSSPSSFLQINRLITVHQLFVSGVLFFVDYRRRVLDRLRTFSVSNRHGQTRPIKGRLSSRFWIRFFPILDVSLDIIEHTVIDDNRGEKRPQTRFWIWVILCEAVLTTIFAFIIEAKSDAIIRTV